MNFNNQINNIFNQRREEHIENQRLDDDAVQLLLNNAYNELQQLADDNDILLDINVEVGEEIPAGQVYRENVMQAATQFYLNILNIFVQRGRELPPLDGGGGIGWQAMYIAHNRLVLELGHNNGLGIEVTVLNMNNQLVQLPELDELLPAQWRALAVNNNNMPLHWQPAEPLPRGDMLHLIPAANLDEMAQENLLPDGVQRALDLGAYP